MWCDKVIAKIKGCNFLPHSVVPYQTLWQYSDGDLLTGGVECRWGRRFSANIAITCCERLDC